MTKPERNTGTLGITTGGEKPAPAKKAPVRKATTKAAQQDGKQPEQGDVGDNSRAGEGTAGDTTPQTMSVDGFEFDVLPIPARGGTPKPEAYPFSKLPLSKLVNGELVGPSLFIPDDANPSKHFTHARKVAPAGTLYHTRSGEKDGKKGIRVWKTEGVERGKRFA